MLDNEILIIEKKANEESLERGFKEINVDMFLLAICKTKCEAKHLIAKFISPDIIISNIEEQYIDQYLNLTELPTDILSYDNELKKILLESNVEFHNLRVNETERTSKFILLAILANQNTFACSLLNKFGITYSSILEIIKKTPIKETQQPVSNKKKEIILDHYGINLNELGKLNKIKPVIGREREIKRLAEILARKEKNNPLLIGDPGVGKTSIVEGLVLQIVNNTISNFLVNKIVYILDVNRLVSGTKYRGQFEERLKQIIDFLREHNDYIIFVDEIHTIISAGDSENGLDMANVIKPDLARGTIQMIGATTLKEYKKIEKDGALERRFQKIIVSEPTKEETFSIIKELKDFYGNFHKVEYTDDALLECVNLSERYLPNKVYPDKATDLMDEVGAVVKLQKYKLPDVVISLQNEVLSIQELISSLVKEQNYEKAGEAKKKKDELLVKINDLLNEFELKNKPLVEVIDVQKTISTISGIPINKINKSEKEKILHLEQDLKSIVIGQDTAIEALCKSLKRHSVGINDFNKPIGKFIFLGSSGCGKTFCVKELGKLLFGTNQSVIRLDMSEYMEKHSVSKIIGSPPGYVGHESGGGLTEKVKHNPYSIILLDEIEKAHVDVLNLFLQIFDEGTLTDSLGAKINFKNTIIIGTSNLGTSFIQNPIGFGDTKAQYKNKIVDAFNKFFSKEFINRLDDIIIFNQLEKHDIYKILDLQLNEILSRLNMNINIDPSIKDFLIEKGYSKEYGVRELKRTVQKYIEDELADNILSGAIQKTDTVYITYKDAIIINK